MYQFSYSLNNDVAISLSIGQPSTLTHSSSMFPSGLVYCFVVVSDIYNGASVTVANATSSPYQGANLFAFASTVLTANLGSAFSSSDSDKAMQTINMV